MALDGIVIANLIYELNEKIGGGRLSKIAQPEKDALLLTIKKERSQLRLFLSADASLPLIYLTEENKKAPMTAPNFCMLLRKHLNSARITAITQPGLERIVQLELEHLNELGDVCTKYLIVEIMGKHSNIIFCDRDYKIIDSIKHISGLISSVREVLPGRDYFIPKTQEKLEPLSIEETMFFKTVLEKPLPVAKAVYTSLTGISPLIANELCARASIDAQASVSSLTDLEKTHLFHTFSRMMEDVKENLFTPNIVYKGQEPLEFSSLPLLCYQGFPTEEFSSVSALLEKYYAVKEVLTRIRQKSSDLRRITATAIDRARKKYDLQMKQLKDTQKRDTFKIYGELLTTYGYQCKPGDKSLTCDNYYTNEEISIPLDGTLTPLENAKKYFDKYGKLKRTFEALTVQTRESKEELIHLESIASALDIALSEDDLSQIKAELEEYGYIKKHGPSKGKAKKTISKPFHYLSSDGFHIYVGKNNYQNEELTFKFAGGNDWWFHAKGMAGSHVIVKSEGKEELPDRVFEEAGMLAGYYSKGRGYDKVDIDYIQKKHIKKPNGGKPGFVIYHTNYSLTIQPGLGGLREIKD